MAWRSKNTQNVSVYGLKTILLNNCRLRARYSGILLTHMVMRGRKLRKQLVDLHLKNRRVIYNENSMRVWKRNG